MDVADQLGQTLFPGTPRELHLMTAVEVVSNAVSNGDRLLNYEQTVKTVHEALRYLRIKAIVGDVEAKLKLWTLLCQKELLISTVCKHKNDEAALWARSLFDRRLLAALSHCSSELIATLDANADFFTDLLSKAANLGDNTDGCYAEKQKKRMRKKQKNVAYLLGLLFLDGIGVNRDVSKGVQLLTKAFEFGHEGAGLELAKVLKDPYNFPQQYDTAKSIQLFEAIAERKKVNVSLDGFALVDLVRVYFEGSETITRDVGKAYKFARRIAESTGEQYCQYVVGDILLSPPADSSLQQDTQQAIFWLTQSGNQGFPLAVETMARIYFEGKIDGVVKNYELARHWCLLGDDVWPSGLGYCQTCLGDMFYFGLGVPKDLYRAFEYYQKAASQPGASNSYSQFMLGEMFFKTEGWGRNLLVASDYYRMSAKGKYAPAEQRLQELLANEKESRLAEKKAGRRISWLSWPKISIKKERSTMPTYT